MQPDRISSWLERALAYVLAISPPLALFVMLALIARRRPQVRLLLRDRWTAGCAIAVGVLGIVSGILAPSQLVAAQGPVALALLFLVWGVGRFVVQNPRRFWVDLQRGIGVVAAIVLAWIAWPFTFEVSVGSLTIPVARPHDPVAVFGLGANGLGPLLVYGGILALGRLFQEHNVWPRLEALAISLGALTAPLAIGVRNALWGSTIGATVFMLSAGPWTLLPVALSAVFAIGTQSDIRAEFLALARSGTYGLVRGREADWLSALGMIRDHPWLGVGPSHYLHYKPVYAPNADPVEGPHSIFLHMASEWGLPAALVLYAWLLSWPFRLWHRRSEVWRWSLVAGFIAFLAMGFFDDPLFTLHISGPVFAGLGLAASDATAGDG